MRLNVVDLTFRFHWICGKYNLTHICFVDDVLIFSKNEVHSVGIIMNALSEFVELSSIQCNLGKSAIFMCAINNITKECFLELTRFKLGSLPVHCLDVPLVSYRLSALDYSWLLEIITY